MRQHDIDATEFVDLYPVAYLVKAGEQVIAAGRKPNYDEFFKDLGVSRISLDVSDPDCFICLAGGSDKRDDAQTSLESR